MAIESQLGFVDKLVDSGPQISGTCIGPESWSLSLVTVLSVCIANRKTVLLLAMRPTRVDKHQTPVQGAGVPEIRVFTALATTFSCELRWRF